MDEEWLRRKHASEEQVHESSLALREAMGEILFLWNNNLRFASEALLKAHLNRIGRLRGIKGDPLKKNASDLVEAAQTVIDRGVAVWTSRKKSRRH